MYNPPTIIQNTNIFEYECFPTDYVYSRLFITTVSGVLHIKIQREAFFKRLFWLMWVSAVCIYAFHGLSYWCFRFLSNVHCCGWPRFPFFCTPTLLSDVLKYRWPYYKISIARKNTSMRFHAITLVYGSCTTLSNLITPK